MGNGLSFRVPRFQRDYSWDEDQWDDLWSDILATANSAGGGSSHYMGYLVLKTSDNRSFDIIDGQQRLTTLSMLILAALSNLQELIKDKIAPEDNKKREEQLRNAYIGYLDPVTLVSRSKLTLNRHNDDFYQRKLVPLEPSQLRGLNASERLMRKGFHWFFDKVKNESEKRNDGAELARLVENVAKRLFFTVITVNDELNAFTVFETLNARGVRLSATDLLKNYLFSVAQKECGDHEIEDLEKRWEDLVVKVGRESLPDLLRFSWISRHDFVRHADLFKTIRGKIAGRGDVFRLMRNLDDDAVIYSALHDSEDSLWSADEKAHIAELKRFKIRQPFPLLMAAKRSLPPEDFTLVLRACSIISFRYNVIGGLGAHEQERVYSRVAARTAKGTIKDAAAMIRQLREIYLSDNEFANAFAEKQLQTTQSRNKWVAKYILSRLEKQSAGVDYDVDSASYSLEHILPENPETGWDDISDENVERFKYRLGNMALLKTGQNRDLGNAEFSEKKKVYSVSEFELTRNIATENEYWNGERIAQRQRWMANQAKGIWKISQLGE